MTAEEEIEKLFAEHKPLTRLRHIPAEAIRRLHERFELGVANYGEKSWNSHNNPAALTDLEFIRDRIEHAKIHIEHFLAEFALGIGSGKFEFTDDDPAAIMWFGAFAACAQTALLKLQEEKACKTCGGTGGVDSGGFTPWGSPIDVPCPDCQECPAGEDTGKEEFTGAGNIEVFTNVVRDSLQEVWDGFEISGFVPECFRGVIPNKFTANFKQSSFARRVAIALQRRISQADLTGATQQPQYKCPACCDTGCEADPTIPMVESPADCLVPCKRCNDPAIEASRKLISDVIERAEKFMADWPEWKKGILEYSGKPTRSTPREVVDISDIVREYNETLSPNYAPVTPSGCKQPQCLDMLGQDVVSGDMMYFISERLLNVATIEGGNYTNAVRCPRPGEAIKEFDGWRDMCLAMHASGASFHWHDEKAKKWRKGAYKFQNPIENYVRSSDCTWKGRDDRW